MRGAIASSLIILGSLVGPFSQQAQAQNFGFCVSESASDYELARDGLTFQSSGIITSHRGSVSDIEGHRFEFYANSSNGKWAFIEIRGQDQYCFLTGGEMFVHEAERSTDAQQTHRQSITALHPGGDNANVAYELFAHEGTGLWFLQRRTSETRTRIVYGGTGYQWT